MSSGKHRVYSVRARHKWWPLTEYTRRFLEGIRNFFITYLYRSLPTSYENCRSALYACIVKLAECEQSSRSDVKTIFMISECEHVWTQVKCLDHVRNWAHLPPGQTSEHCQNVNKADIRSDVWIRSECDHSLLLVKCEHNWYSLDQKSGPCFLT